MNRVFNYCDFEVDDDGRIFGTKDRTITEEGILDIYWNTWCQTMRRIGRFWLITRENCIQDWVVVNWAWESKYEQD